MRRPIDAVDTIWLNMDRPNNLMVIESVMTSAEPVDWDRFLDVLRSRVLDRFPVFSQRPVFSRLPLLMPQWEDDSEFDLGRHVRRATLAAPGGEAALQDYVNARLGTPLPRDRPLWEVHLIDGYGTGSAVYSRLHHALADGIALMQVLLSLTDVDPDMSAPGVERATGPEATDEACSGGLIGGALHLAASAGSAILEPARLLAPSLAVGAATSVRQTIGVAAKLTLTRSPDSALTGTPGTTKRAVWAPPFPLDDVVTAAHRTGTTVNDILVAALAGAVTTYLLEHDGVARDVPTMVPVNLRPPDEPPPRELGNRFALVLFTLPSGLPTPFARLAETKRRMDAIKESPEAGLTFGMIRGIGRTGATFERYLVDFFANKATGITTNVLGPQEPRYVAGSRITSMLGWAPESGNQTLGTCIFTYDGQVHVGFKVDTDTIAHPDELVTAFLAETQALLDLANVEQANVEQGA